MDDFNMISKFFMDESMVKLWNTILD